MNRYHAQSIQKNVSILESAPCQGDSGGGLIVEKNSQTYLAGVVSGAKGQNSQLCLPTNNILFSDAGDYYDLYQKASRYVQQNPARETISTDEGFTKLSRKSCAATYVSCKQAKCIPFEQLCDGRANCDNDELDEQCEFRATHHMLITGVSILKVYIINIG